MTREICFLNNTIQDYAWGSTTAIPELLGLPSDPNRPRAELWLGAHPKAPSRIVIGESETPLDQAIERAPREILGPSVAARFDNHLPFLLKILAAAEPLSIQAHPNRDQARAGFERENHAGVALDDPRRNYKDPNHKPELICALTPFSALIGFRPIPTMLDLLKRVSCETIRPELEAFRARPDRDGLVRFFGALLTMPNDRQARAAAEAVTNLPDAGDDEPAFAWSRALYDQKPGDIGALCPLLLNVVELEPGQGLFQPAGELHSYLRGVGVEIMANSDNVLRGGMTVKHVDPPELLKILTFRCGEAEILEPTALSAGEAAFETPVDEFRLSVLEIDEGRSFRSSSERSVEILLCVEGDCRIVGAKGDKGLRLSRGRSVLVPAAAPAYVLEGRGQVFKAWVSSIMA
jgi:mannose-6-phosphate isomerase